MCDEPKAWVVLASTTVRSSSIVLYCSMHQMYMYRYIERLALLFKRHQRPSKQVLGSACDDEGFYEHNHVENKETCL